MAKAWEAVARADALLREKLSPEQRADLARSHSFLVITPAGRRYRLHQDRTNYQVDLLAPDSEYALAKYCVQPRDREIPTSDSLLAQMLLLQSDEALFLLTANVQLSVHNLARYLSGEVVPRAPNTPEHEPRIVEYNDDQPVTFTGNTTRRPNRREVAQQRIVTDYRCASHPQARVDGVSESADGRGFHVRYQCECPTQYVSLRAHEERQRQLGAPVAENNRAIGTGESPRVTFDPPPPVALHQRTCGCRNWTQERSLDGTVFVFRFGCGARRAVNLRELVE